MKTEDVFYSAEGKIKWHRIIFKKHNIDISIITKQITIHFNEWPNDKKEKKKKKQIHFIKISYKEFIQKP